jgi:hypothetical protein
MLHTIGCWAGGYEQAQAGFAILVTSNLISTKGRLRKITARLGIAIPFIIILNIDETQLTGTELRLWVCVPNKLGSNPGCSTVMVGLV